MKNRDIRMDYTRTPKKHGLTVHKKGKQTNMTKHLYLHQKLSSQSFTKLPNFLFEVPAFQPLSSEAKLMYAMILRRAELSCKNGWSDEYGKVFIHYAIIEVMALLHCGKQKAVNTLRELQYADLVDIRKQGCGKPNRLYPKVYEVPKPQTS